MRSRKSIDVLVPSQTNKGLVGKNPSKNSNLSQSRRSKVADSDLIKTLKSGIFFLLKNDKNSKSASARLGHQTTERLFIFTRGE